MIEMLQKHYALSRQGAKDLVKGCVACAVQNLSFMFPACLLYLLVRDLLNGSLAGRAGWYAAGCIACILFILAATWFQYNGTYLATYLESGVRRVTLAERLRKIPLSFFGKKDLADLTSTLMADCAFLETAFSHFIPELAGSILSCLLVAAGIFFFDWRMALASLWVLPVSFLIVWLSAKVQESLSRKSMAAKMACADGIQECIETVRDLKSCNAEEAYLNGLYTKIDTVEHRAIVSELGTAVFVVSASLVLKLGIATTALVGSVLLSGGSLDVLTFFAFLLVASRLYEPLQGALQNLAAIISARTNIARMNEILCHPTQEGCDTLTNLGCDITFEHVGFSYSGGETVLRDVSFTAKQGQVTALVGPSGGGKTTIARLIPRFFDVQAGAVLLGGRDVRSIPTAELMEQISFVFQEVRLFKKSIRDNIRAARPDATEAEILHAAQLAQCSDILEKTPGGLDAVIGAKGVYLSGGEMQRIALARAILKDAPIVVLDEASSFADPENEAKIQKAFEALMKGKTVLMIAHRLSTVRNMDRILVVRDGEIAEEGKHDELLEKGGVYAAMWEEYQKAAQWKVGGAA